MASVYLDSSFVSALATGRIDPMSQYRKRTSLDWWNRFRHEHDLYVSAEVLLEVGDPGHQTGTEALDFIDDVPLLEIDDETRSIAQTLVAEKVMPQPIAGDAIHVAVATAHRVAYLMSWNVRHLANPNKLLHLHVVCERLGVIPPTILTPELLWGS